MLVQWPTIITVATWPLLIAVYYRLARREERDAESAFGDVYRAYKARTPMFIPRFPGCNRARHGDSSSSLLLTARRWSDSRGPSPPRERRSEWSQDTSLEPRERDRHVRPSTPTRLLTDTGSR